MPQIQDDRTSSMSVTDKTGEAMRRSLPLLPGDARDVVLAMLQPKSLAMIGATLVGWAASHFFGVGEVVDVILLVAGVVALGFSVFSGARELLDFAQTVTKAKHDQDLDTAAQHFARAVIILGISTVQAVLLKGQAKAVVARGRPQIYPRMGVGTPPPAGNQLRVTRPASLPDGSLGGTDAYGVIEVSRAQPLSEQQATLLHEMVHRYFSPRTGPFRQIRAELNMSAYDRSALLRYLEEALAEGYMELKMNGLAAAMKAYKFPVARGYVTVSEMMGEGQSIGTITLGGALFYVSISTGPLPRGE